MSIEPELLSIRQTVVAARKQRGWSQSGLAERSGVSTPTIARFETGANISLDKLEQVVAVLGLRVTVTPIVDSQSPSE